MSKTLEFKVIVNQKGRIPKEYNKSLNINYNDETFRDCEAMIKDVLHTIANKFIHEEFYGG